MEASPLTKQRPGGLAGSLRSCAGVHQNHFLILYKSWSFSGDVLKNMFFLATTSMDQHDPYFFYSAGS